MPSKKNKNKKKHQQQQQQNKQQQQQQTLLVENSKPEIETKLPYKIEFSEIYGRHLVASKDLKPGELLIVEKPLVIGPCVTADPVCLGCYKPVELNAMQYRCPSCNWPLCNEKCRGLNQADGHTNYECEFLKNCKTNAGDLLSPKSTPVEIKNLYELIVILRILLLKKFNNENYMKIHEMQSHNEKRQKNVELWQHYEKNVVQRLKEKWQLKDFSELEIHTVCGILDVNCFEIGQNGCKARTLYPSAFFLAHDCTPNTSHTDDPDSYAILLRTSRKVRKNEPLTLSYAYTLEGTLKRREFMHAGKLFWCCCKRCSDPLELDTDCSAIICSKCKKGSIRSMKPLEQDANWNCDKCDLTLKATEISKLLDVINDDLESIDVHDVVGLENFLLRCSNVLGPNHYLILSAKYLLCQIYGRIEGYLLPQMSIEDIKRKEKYCREFLAVISILDPGLSRLRGLIMYELHAPVLVLAQYKMQQHLISRRDFNEAIREVKKLLLESKNMLLLEPLGSNEHQMGLAAEKALHEMEAN